MNLDYLIDSNNATLDRMHLSFLKVGKSSIVGKDIVLGLILKCIQYIEEMNKLLTAANGVADHRVQRKTHEDVERIADELCKNTHRIEEFISLKDIGQLPD